MQFYLIFPGLQGGGRRNQKTSLVMTKKRALLEGCFFLHQSKDRVRNEVCLYIKLKKEDAMKIFSSVSFVILPVALLAAAPAIAEQVGHHGYTVEEKGTTESCLSCHDGSIGRNVMVCTVKCDYRTSHPIEKRYPPSGKVAYFASLAQVTARGVRIVNGKVTCISCHDLKKQTAHHLVLDENGRNCEICHIRY